MSTLELKGITQEFVTGPLFRRSANVAVDQVSLEIRRGEAVALVGESGSGKTTIGRIMVGLQKPTSGEVLIDGAPALSETSEDRRRVQMVFQNTQNAFNPRRRVRSIITDPLRIHQLVPKEEQHQRAVQLFEQVGLDPAMLDRFPHEFSGGQRQRVNIARALALGPQFLVADEPVSALDVSVQAQILNLLSRLRSEQGMGMLFISHDMRAVSFLCDRIAVLYRGRLVEVGTRDQVLEEPRHPYTKALLDSVPVLERSTARLARVSQMGEAGDTPSGGCNFRDRCALRVALSSPIECETTKPDLQVQACGASAACHFSAEQMKENAA